ncbi:MAG TPA: 1,6-anhydro-N-acetylmuramyl-L-alanine amidase AmpD [Crenotrichaceae bacterium]|nr:1,6-anhydro-N-acetylmuramyl-L-alanine amidase AmpD [Crenotrichaceae bacterium]
MSHIISNHWLVKARHVLSPNCDKRNEEDDISLIVIHCISLPPGHFGTHYIDQLFTNCLDPDEHPYFKKIHRLNVSSHVLISRDGNITQYVPFNLRAWHAGQSCYKGRACCNNFSIGIELEGTDTGLYTNEQYQQLTDITAVLLKNYISLSTSDITGHSNIAPERKQDPGPGFDWNCFHDMLTKKL